MTDLDVEWIMDENELRFKSREISMETAITPSIVKNVVRISRKRGKQVRTRISYLTAEQLDRFLRAAKEHGPREHAMFLFAVAHGARAQEIFNLRLSDVNFANEQIHIALLKGSLPSTQTLLRVKGNSRFDEKAALRAWLAVRKPDAGDYGFNSQKSIQLSRVTVFKLYRQIARKADLGETLQHPHVQALLRDVPGPARRQRLFDQAGFGS